MFVIIHFNAATLQIISTENSILLNLYEKKNVERKAVERKDEVMHFYCVF